MRTRWRLSPGGTAGTVTKKILFRGKSGVDLCLGTLRLQLKHVAWDIKEFSQGLYHVQFHGPTIAMHQSLVYEKAAGMIYSIHEWNNKYAREKSFIQTARPGKPSVAAIPSQERAALIALYNSTAGAQWYDKRGWKTPPLAGDGFALPGTENTWYGITCDPGNATVQSIFLWYNNLNGGIPPELGNLAKLQYLGLWCTQISGSIPPELGNLGNLRELDLNSNQLSGSIPPEFGNLAKLRWCILWNNQLSGSIPSNLINLKKLRDSASDLRWNGLYTNDDILKDFLNLKQIGGNWENTQTIAPSNVVATSISTTSININWVPITFTSGTGGYRVFYSTTTGGAVYLFQHDRGQN